MHEPGAVLAGPLEEHVRAEHIGVDELARANDRAIDVRLGGEVHAHLAVLTGPRHRLGINDIPFDQLVADAVEVGPITRVRQLVEDYDVVPGRDEPLYEMAANEPAAACDKDSHVAILRDVHARTIRHDDPQS